MPAFLEDITPFYGTGEKNENGQDLESFLKEYDTKKYDNPSVTVDTLVIQHDSNLNTVNTGLKLLMIKRRNHPSIGYWALPGGFVNIREDLIDAAKRELQEETGLTNIPMEQVFTWGEANRDPRARIVTVTYLALVEEDLKAVAADDAADAAWMNINFNQTGIEECSKEGIIKITYELKLSNIEKQVELHAMIEVVKNKKGLIKEANYKVISSMGIAFDHPRCIAQGLLYIQNLING